MHPRTLATIAQLESADWFAHVGEPHDDAVRVVSSWREAVESCSTLDWENLCLEASNQLRMRVLERDRQMYARWNAIVADVRPATGELVKRKTAHWVEKEGLPKAFVDCVHWDMLGVAVEAELAEIVRPAFFASQAYWYTVGRFPCGWDGDFPAGRLVIY